VSRWLPAACATHHCQLTVNTFGDYGRFIGGNRCERPITRAAEQNELNLYRYKLELLESYAL
jgi:hypothetical protein